MRDGGEGFMLPSVYTLTGSLGYSLSVEHADVIAASKVHLRTGCAYVVERLVERRGRMICCRLVVLHMACVVVYPMAERR